MWDKLETTSQRQLPLLILRVLAMHVHDHDLMILQPIPDVTGVFVALVFHWHAQQKQFYAQFDHLMLA
jgi:hypothetical protein